MVNSTDGINSVTQSRRYKNKIYLGVGRVTHLHSRSFLKLVSEEYAINWWSPAARERQEHWHDPVAHEIGLRQMAPGLRSSLKGVFA